MGIKASTFSSMWSPAREIPPLGTSAPPAAMALWPDDFLLTEGMEKVRRGVIFFLYFYSGIIKCTSELQRLVFPTWVSPY